MKSKAKQRVGLESRENEQETEKKSDANDIEERLRALQNLYDQRLITKEEYDEKKQEILKEL